jgi:signal transduction histidine kinase
LTQIFVSRTDLFPARYLNAELFLSLFGFPVQTIRATMAVLVTINLLRAIQVVDREREAQLLTAQQARLEALEQVQRELLAREAMRRELLRHTVIAQEEERGRIARELHDETAQALTALTLNLATLRHSLPKHQNTLELINRLQDLCQQMAKSLYRIVHDLRPAQLDDLGLVATLEYLADEARQRLGLEVVLSVSGTRRRLDPLIETVIFRVAQEALTNVGRHAEIRQASASLLFEAHRVVLRIRDYGRGFDVNQTLAPPRGWGLVGMRERAESIGGRLHLLSSPGAGTLVEVSVPLAEENPHETHSTDGSG